VGFQAGDFIAQSDVLLGQTLETAVIIHLLLNLGSLFGRDAVVELFPMEKALENEVRAPLGGLARWGLEKLLAQTTATEVVDGLHIKEDEISFFAQGLNLSRHEQSVYTDIQ